MQKPGGISRNKHLQKLTESLKKRSVILAFVPTINLILSTHYWLQFSINWVFVHLLINYSIQIIELCYFYWFVGNPTYQNVYRPLFEMFNYIIIFQYLGTVFVPLSKIGGQSSLLFCYSIFFSCFCYFNDVSLVILDDETVHDNILLIFVFHKQWNIYTLSNQKQWFIFFCNKCFWSNFVFWL